MKRALVICFVVAAAVTGACTQVSGDPKAIVAISFDSLPYPAVVSGDTLRDENGIVLPLHAAALNTDGAEVADAGVTYVVLDTGVTVSASGIVTSTNVTTASARILAQAGTLQSRPIVLVVTPRPDSIALDGVVDTLRYTIVDATGNTSSAITLKVLSNTKSPAEAARGWIVRYALEYHGTAVPANSTTLAWMVDDNNRRSAEDTTTTDGHVARKVRVISTALLTTEDSITVIARASARGSNLAGAPLRVVVRIIPRG